MFWGFVFRNDLLYKTKALAHLFSDLDVFRPTKNAEENNYVPVTHFANNSDWCFFIWGDLSYLQQKRKASQHSLSDLNGSQERVFFVCIKSFINKKTEFRLVSKPIMFVKLKHLNISFQI